MAHSICTHHGNIYGPPEYKYVGGCDHPGCLKGGDRELIGRCDLCRGIFCSDHLPSELCVECEARDSKEQENG